MKNGNIAEAVDSSDDETETQETEQNVDGEITETVDCSDDETETQEIEQNIVDDVVIGEEVEVW